MVGCHDRQEEGGDAASHQVHGNANQNDVNLQFQVEDGNQITQETTDNDAGIADSIASEIGGSIFEFNTCMTGEVYADAYLDQMGNNLELLQYLG